VLEAEHQMTEQSIQQQQQQPKGLTYMMTKGGQSQDSLILYAQAKKD